VVDGTSALNDKSEPGPRQLTTVEGVSALNDKRKSGPKKLSVGEVISLLNVKIVVEIAPEEEAEEDSASGAMNDAPGAEHASGGGMAIGGQSSGVEMSGGPTEPTSASTTTAEQVFVGVSSFIASQTVAAANVCDAGDGGTAGADVMKAQELGSPQHGSDVGLASEKNRQETLQQAERCMT
jgi:hypothetical protein